MIRKFTFSLATTYHGSKVIEEYEYDMNDFVEQSEEEFMKVVQEHYEDWVWENNYGGFWEED